MNMSDKSYRPRNPGHNYYGRGTYLVTLIVKGREPLLGCLNDDITNPEVRLSPIGEVVQQLWNILPAKQAFFGNNVIVHACVCMPDHFHGVIEVLEPMKWNLGDILQAFKAACTSRWQQLQGLPLSTNRPISVDWDNPKIPDWLREKALRHSTEGSLVRFLSKKQRQEYYTLVGKEYRPLFDDNYDDTVCLDNRHREAMIAYVHDNPRRNILRRKFPDVLQRCLKVQIGDHCYGTFGNLFLLRWANKVQVQCHRKHPVNGQPYETTDDYVRQYERWLETIMGGATVVVTPGISRGELLMKNECLENGYPLIHLQNEPVNRYWKPEKRRFEACVRGNLLILAPWGLDNMDSVDGAPSCSDYSRFHNLNKLAAEICAFSGNAKIVF